MLSINLEKGQSLDLTKKSPGLTKVFIGAGWDMKKSGAAMDADLMATLLTSNGKVRNAKDIIYFNNKGRDGDAIWHSGDNLTGEGEGDDEVINVDLSKIPAEINKITFTINIYNAASKGQSLSDLDNAFIRVVDAVNNQELANFKITDLTGTNITYCHLVRGGDGWEFHADGTTGSEDLNQIVNKYAA